MIRTGALLAWTRHAILARSWLGGAALAQSVLRSRCVYVCSYIVERERQREREREREREGGKEGGIVRKGRRGREGKRGYLTLLFSSSPETGGGGEGEGSPRWCTQRQCGVRQQDEDSGQRWRYNSLPCECEWLGTYRYPSSSLYTPRLPWPLFLSQGHIHTQIYAHQHTLEHPHIP